ncbi:MAG TPA: condensation domain-containing protein, partial [Thermoanaerobaculia bacterium]|nr:condensation domain-containing protein [Thermoanaerobaculia bacterium]
MCAAARPASPLEEVLTALWTEVLGRAPAGVHETFFELGGHSLLAVRLLARVRQTLEVDLPVSALFEAPTVALLAAVVEDARGSVPATAPPLRRALRDGGLPLAAAQRRIWFLQQLAPGSPAYNMTAAVRLRGPLDRDALRRAVAALGRRHEPLRTAFPLRDRQPVQEIVPRLEIALREIDLDGALPEERARQEAVCPFDVETAPLARFTLLELTAPDDHLLLVTLHHLIADGGSIGLLLEDLAALYGAFAAGEPSPLPEPELQYVDYAVWQQQPPAEELERQLAWWRARLDGLEPLELPTDRPRPASDETGGAGGLRSLALPADAVTVVAELGGREAATPFMVLLAGFLLLLHRYTGQDDLAVGAPVSQRDRGELDRMVGMFVNILVLRVDVTDGRDLLRRVRGAVIESFARQDLPFDRLVAALRPERGAGSPQLVQAAFVLQDEPWPAPRAAGLALEAAEVHNGAAKFDLTLAVARRPEGLAATIEYRADLFDGATAQRWLGHFASLLRAMADPGADLRSLPLLSAEERHQLLVEANDTALAPSLETGLVHERIARRAAERPDALAVASEDTTLTYAELNRRANRLARHLRSLGVGPEVRVGVHLGREPELLVALVAVLKAGGAFLPLEPGLPAERLEHMASDAGAPLVVTRETLAPAGLGGAIPVLIDRDEEAIAA